MRRGHAVSSPSLPPFRAPATGPPRPPPIVLSSSIFLPQTSCILATRGDDGIEKTRQRPDQSGALERHPPRPPGRFAGAACALLAFRRPEAVRRALLDRPLGSPGGR